MLPLLHQGENNQNDVEIMQLSFVAVAPLLAAALTLYCSVAVQIKCSGIWPRQTVNNSSNRTVAYDIDPSPAPLSKSQVFMPVATRPGVNVFLSSCGLGNHHREAELEYMRNRDADASNVSGMQSKTSTGLCLLIKI